MTSTETFEWIYGMTGIMLTILICMADVKPTYTNIACKTTAAVFVYITVMKILYY